MQTAIQLNDQAYAIAKAFAEEAHCSVASAVSKLVVKAGYNGKNKARPTGDIAIRFPLVRGARKITSEDVARLEDEG